jgi:hypothetical protein
MLHLQSQIELDVPAGQAFALLCDPVRKTELNPQVEAVLAAVLSTGPLGVGSRIHYHLRTATGHRIFNCTVTAFEPDRVLEVVSDTHPPFRARQSLEPTLYGCMLMHEEWIEAGHAQVQAGGRQRPLPFLLRVMEAAVAHSMPTPAEMDLDQQETLKSELQQALDLWLGQIKACLETTHHELPDSNSAMVT